MRSTGTTGSGGEERSLFHQEKGARIEPLLSALGEVCNAARSAAADVQLTTGFQEPSTDHFLQYSSDGFADQPLVAINHI